MPVVLLLGIFGVCREGSCGSGLEEPRVCPQLSTWCSSCPSLLPLLPSLPRGEAELTQAAPALPDVLGAPPWPGIWFSLGWAGPQNRAFQPSWLHRNPAGKGQGQRKVGIKWKRG